MTTALSDSEISTRTPARPAAFLRPAWMAGGALALVAAGAAGALIMRGVDSAPPAAATQTAATAAVGQPVPLVANAAPAAPVPEHRPQALAQVPAPAPQAAPRAAVCRSCGVVESVTAVRHKGQGTGLGAVAGGVVGGVVGHQLGGGKGKTALTVLGAVGGGFAGNEVEKRARADTSYSVLVRMDDGTRRTLERKQSIAIGTHVVVEGATLRLAHGAGKANSAGA
jgi:outer membrane lipoprotein SlyB